MTRWKAECELKEAERYLHEMRKAVELTAAEDAALVAEVEKAEQRVKEF